MVQQITVGTNEIYQLVFLKDVVLDHYMRRAMTGSFRRGPFSLFSISKKSAKLKCLSKLLEVLIKLISKTFST